MTQQVVQAALDLVALRDWLREHQVSVTGGLQAELIQGGRSNLTFFVTDEAGSRWVLRRPPLGTVLATAHDVGREYRVMRALATTDVRVPQVIGVGTGSDDVPFYVMHEVHGLVVRSQSDGAALEHEARVRCGRALVEGLAALHRVDPAAVGLDQLGRGDDYLTRQILMWQRQAEQHRTEPFPAADAVRDQLLAHVPEQSAVRLVHGDYRLDNVLVDEQGELQAILDWELCTRGDPLVDLAVFLYYWTEADDPVRPFPDPPSLLTGFPRRDDLLDLYASATGCSPDRWNYYLGYAAWRLALVFEGVAGRSASGAYGLPDADEDRRLRTTVRELVGHAEALLSRDPG